MWHNIYTNKDIEQMLEMFGGFHDACIRTVSYDSGLYVDDNLYINDTQSSIEILFERQSESNKKLCIRFTNVLEFSINKSRNYIHEIYDISMFIKDECVYWGDSEDFEASYPSYTGSWLCSQSAMWSFCD